MPVAENGIFERSEKIPAGAKGSVSNLLRANSSLIFLIYFARMPVAEEGITEQSDVIPLEAQRARDL